MIEGDVQGAQEIDDEFADLFGMGRVEKKPVAASEKTATVIDLSLDERYTVTGYGTRDSQRRRLEKVIASVKVDILWIMFCRIEQRGEPSQLQILQPRQISMLLSFFMDSLAQNTHLLN